MEVIMNIKSDNMLSGLRSFGFTCEEKTQEGFLRYQKRLGNLLVTVANGQFENKIRISMLQDMDGVIRTSYNDILEYTELIGEFIRTGMVSDDVMMQQEHMQVMDNIAEEFDVMDNPLLGAPRKPKGFMAQ